MLATSTHLWCSCVSTPLTVIRLSATGHSLSTYALHAYYWKRKNIYWNLIAITVPSIFLHSRFGGCFEVSLFKKNHAKHFDSDLQNDESFFATNNGENLFQFDNDSIQSIDRDTRWRTTSQTGNTCSSGSQSSYDEPGVISNCGKYWVRIHTYICICIYIYIYIHRYIVNR